MANRISDAELDAFLTNAAANDVRQSGTVDALSAAAGNNTGSQTAPPKATAAPKKTNDIFTGLAEALNTFQRRLSDPKDPNRKYDVPDEYVIEFSPTTLGDATLKRQGTTDKSKVPMQKPTPQAKNPASNNVNTSASSISVSAGMQIVQFIDQVMRSSSFITDQQLYIIDPETQETKPNPNPPGGITSWYKVSVEATQLAYDAKRHDHAYRMKFVITPYAINSLPSDWFQNSRYRGSHKSYNYWFTGANTEIRNFEQEFNNLYRLVISGLNVPVQQARTDFRDQYRRTFLPTSENHAKGADGYVNEAADNAASFLYSPTDQAKAKLRIVGDPAWMQQGEVATGVSARNFNFDPFNDDGTINYDSQEVVFDISWNAPADYDANTGLAEINKTGRKSDGTYATQPQYNYTYTAIKCKNIFSKGTFEQELEGRLLIEYEKNKQSTDAFRSAARGGNLGYAVRDETGQASTLRKNEYGDYYTPVLTSQEYAEADANQQSADPQPLPAPPPQPPTSPADIDTTTGFTTPTGVGSGSPPTADLAASPNEGVKEKLEQANNYEQRAAEARARGDVYNAATLTRLANIARESAIADAKFGAPPQIKPAQLTAKDT